MRTYSLFLPLKEHTKTSWFTCLQEVPLRLPHRPHSTTRGGWKPAPLHECGHRRDSGHCALPVLHAVPPRVPAPQHVLPNAHEDGAACFPKCARSWLCVKWCGCGNGEPENKRWRRGRWVSGGTGESCVFELHCQCAPVPA
eukprot:1156924-Pelagomonas_calceolata.AAC.9